MAIVNYIPKKIAVLDKRNANGGYYEAVCDNCGRTFFPKSRKARFCCSDCRNNNYVKLHPTKNKQKKVISRPERLIPEALKTVKSKSVTVAGAKQVIKYLEQVKENAVYRQTGYYKGLILELACGETENIGKYVIERISQLKYEVKRSS
jgi:uncharacterized Zn finger protein (UPF0148 family)